MVELNYDPKIADQFSILPGAVEKLLREGQPVRFTAAGNSMHPTIKAGDTLIIEPCDPANLTIGDIVLCKHDDRLFAHRIIRIDFISDCDCPSDSEEHAVASRAESPLPKSRFRQDAPAARRTYSSMQRSPNRYDLRFVLRGDFRPNPDPPIAAKRILGKIVAVERDRQLLSPYRCGKRLIAGACLVASQLKARLPI